MIFVSLFSAVALVAGAATTSSDDLCVQAHNNLPQFHNQPPCIAA